MAVDTGAATVYEDRFMSPNERVKDMIIDFYQRAQFAYIKGDKLTFAKTVKACQNVYMILATADWKALFKEFDLAEQKDIELLETEAKKEKWTKEKTKEETEDLLYKYALIRMEWLVGRMSSGQLSLNDLTVDFVVPETREDLEKVRLMVSEGMPRELWNLSKRRVH